MISSYRLSANPRLSNPGPRLALEAATTLVAVSPAGSLFATDDQPRSSCATTAPGSTGTGVTVGVSFRPLPVTVHTPVEPRFTQPSSIDFSRPAMLAAEAGSTNTPSVAATR